MVSSLFLTDLTGLLAGIALGVLWILLPGAAVARLFDRLGLDCGLGWQRLGWSLVLAFSLLPAIDALLVRIGGMIALTCLHGALALYGLIRPRLLWPRDARS